jgi:hypothetical protein
LSLAGGTGFDSLWSEALFSTVKLAGLFGGEGFAALSTVALAGL